ncbi:erythromycin esterase family protein [Streptomyces sp. NPDC004008]
MFHEVCLQEFLLLFAHAPRAAEVLRSAHLERAIGLIYRPDTEWPSHYFRARVPDRVRRGHPRRRESGCRVAGAHGEGRRARFPKGTGWACETKRRKNRTHG